MNSQLKVGIAGYGVVGKRRHEFIKQIPTLNVVAVCDVIFSENQTSQDDISYYQTYKELLENESLDILLVCLPNYLAPEVTIKGLKLGLHVMCEKPPGRNVQDILNVIEEERKHPNLKLKYGFNHRYHHSVTKAKDIIESKQLGDILNLRGVYGKREIIPFEGGWRASRKDAGGGILLDQGIHMLDLICFFCGNFDEVKSFVDNSYWNHEVEDNAFALMRNKKNQVAIIHSSATQWEHCFSLEIALEKGFIKLKGILSGSKSYGNEELIVGRKDDNRFGKNQEEKFRYLEDPSWKEELNEFIDSIINNQPIKYGTSKEALDVMMLVEKIYSSDLEWVKKINLFKKSEELV